MKGYDKKYMELALDEARKALDSGEIPVGCVIVHNNEIISSAHNIKEANLDPTAHAEIVAIRRASSKIGNWRLSNCTMYVTLEPCPMCTTAILYSRIGRLVFGAFDPKFGGCVSRLNLPEEFPELGSILIEGGVLQDDCENILKSFFESKRQ